MHERRQTGERVALVHIDFPDGQTQEDLVEFEELAKSAGATVVRIVGGSRQVPDAKYFIGTGKAQEIQELVAAENIQLVIFNHVLSAGQERNLEQLIKARVLDRTGLILDIFAQRARTFEGKLQVELAQCQHYATRLVRGWTHLERQKGGIGMRGPGETQLETDRRLLAERMKAIRKRLEKVASDRAQGRQSRQKAAIPTASLVGYTNAGKSTLFNRLCDSNVYAADQLFATLDPTLRRMELASGHPVIIADTVGFIRHLPHDLVVSFRTTLEETREATLLLHVIDVSHKNRDDNILQVNHVLQTIEADTVPQLHVYNKIDITGELPAIKRDTAGRPTDVWLSAATGVGMDLLFQAMRELLYGNPVERTVVLTAEEGKLRAQLYAKAAVLSETITDDGHWKLQLRLSLSDLEQYFPQFTTTDPPP